MFPNTNQGSCFLDTAWGPGPALDTSSPGHKYTWGSRVSSLGPYNSPRRSELILLFPFDRWGHGGVGGHPQVRRGRVWIQLLGARSPSLSRSRRGFPLAPFPPLPGATRPSPMGFGLFPGLPGGSPGLPLPSEAGSRGAADFCGEQGAGVSGGGGRGRPNSEGHLRPEPGTGGLGRRPPLTEPAPPTPQWGVDPEFHSEGWCACQVLSPGTSGSGPIRWRIRGLSPRDDSGEQVRSTPLAGE